MRKINGIVMVEGNVDCNVYVFQDVLIDTGTGKNMDYILKSIQEAGVNLDDLSLIVNTHNHYDHVGGNQCLDLKVAMHQEDAQAMENGDDIATAAIMFGESMGKMKVDWKLQEGDKIHDFEVLHTPGHTRGGICLYDGKTLISGDTVFTDGGFGRMDLGGNVQDMRESLKRLSKLEVKYLLPGHGPCTDEGSKHIQLAYKILKTI
ncbi:MAG TPA: MBL fold metallo-hydrolase [Methanobacterium sp.]|jgi:glyoxylase-like metal-dependent hydrolase (beta-lactamase superfamily II)|nr:MAG: MBL fold metallo-hydrolase [Methanobacterium sp.]HPX77218.1 MBL fold metallo-hydrolase [Methanobacterium sp.]